MTKNIIILSAVIVTILAMIAVYGYTKTNDNGYANTNANAVIGGPAAEVSPKTYDFNMVVYGEIASHIFQISNLGNQPLEILKVSTSCGCTKAAVAEADRIVAPGQSVNMIVTFDPAIHKDDTDLGPLTRIIYITTNDPNNPEIEAEITANVIKK
ncbi:MAG TPA: DUF1573 domain-containing protein [Patescibacteria group bacterium]|nr:DUF1573 domain-containing protein [Patescibacteria group bacterium]